MKNVDTEVVIVGAGPIGLEMAAVLSRAQIPYLHFEPGQVGETLLTWPPNTNSGTGYGYYSCSTKK